MVKQIEYSSNVKADQDYRCSYCDGLIPASTWYYQPQPGLKLCTNTCARKMAESHQRKVYSESIDFIESSIDVIDDCLGSLKDAMRNKDRSKIYSAVNRIIDRAEALADLEMPEEISLTSQLPQEVQHCIDRGMAVKR